MTNRPSFLKNNKKKICLICEGYEEFDYISKLLELKVWADVYDFTLVNAESNGNISARYQDKYQSNNFDIVTVVTIGLVASCTITISLGIYFSFI